MGWRWRTILKQSAQLAQWAPPLTLTTQRQRRCDLRPPCLKIWRKHSHTRASCASTTLTTQVGSQPEIRSRGRAHIQQQFPMTFWVILAYMCVKLQMRSCVCHCVGHFGSILGPFWVPLGPVFGSIFGSIGVPVWVQFGSIMLLFNQYSNKNRCSDKNQCLDKNAL